MLRKIINFLNPMKHLGEKNYPLVFPLLMTLLAYVLSEFFGYLIFKNPNAMGSPDVILTLILVLYFSFRSGIKGGAIVSFESLIFFTYYIATRHASLLEKEVAAITASAVVIISFFIAFTVGWLKQIIDDLLAKETEEKMKAEEERERLKTLIELVPVGIGISEDPEGKHITANKIFREILQLDSHQNASLSAPILNRPSFKALKNGDRIKNDELPMQRAGRTGKPVLGEEFDIQHNDGSVTNLLSYATPLFDKHKKVTSVIAAFLDITERKQIEQQKDDFIAMASHELKTPLTSVKVFTQLLKRRFENTSDKESLRILSKMDTSLNSLDELIRSILQATRIQQGKIPVELEDFLIKDLAKDIVEDLQPITTHKLVLDWHTKLIIHADKERVRQVLVNLIMNAIKYSPHGKKVIIGSQQIDGFIEIYVQDFGIGIPKKEQRKIFERFYQSSAHKTYPGLGLGLYISGEIIKANGGKMWVKSEEGKGSIFHFTLPITKKRKNTNK